MPMQNSYEFQDKKRDLTEAFVGLVAKEPILLSLIGNGKRATSTKVEWVEDYISQSNTEITAVSGSGTGTAITVVSASNISEGEILAFEKADGTDREELVRVVSIAGNVLTVTRNYGSYVANPVTLEATDRVISVSKPRNEGTLAVASSGRQPSKQYNFTQIFDRTAQVSLTAQSLTYDGMDDLINDQVAFKLKEIAYEMNQAIIRGVRQERTASIEGTMGGLLSYIKGGNVVSAGGNAITSTHINDVLQMCFADGAVSNQFVILCADNQARKISKFNTSGANPLVTVAQDSQTTGNYISSFVGDLPVKGGFVATVAVEPNFPKNKIAIIDLNRVKMRWLRPMQDKDATTAGADFIARRIIGEATLEVKNGQYAHGLITGLAV